MSVDVKLRYGTCPTCGERTYMKSWGREPKETTFADMENVPQWRTFEPGPEATVLLGCGCAVVGDADSIAQLVATFKPTEDIST